MEIHPEIKNQLLLKSRLGHKTLALLIDPDDDLDETADLTEYALMQGVELFFIGGSLVSKGNTEKTTKLVKDLGAPMVVLFPGNEIQVNKHADAILFMSLISGRNPEYLIGKQVATASLIHQLKLEAIPTGYILVESGKLTSAHYISQTFPVPMDKPDLAATTALAGKMMGMEVMYLDAGSGAEKPISSEMLKSVKDTSRCLLIAGGGIRNAEQARTSWEAGADIVVVGNAAANDHTILKSIHKVAKGLNKLVPQS